MPKGTIRKRCPYCQGSSTKRHSIFVVKRITLQGVEHKGIQRWYCKDCNRAFTPQHQTIGTDRYTLEVYEKVAIVYFDQGASYRGVSRDLKRHSININAKRCWRMIQRLASNCNAPWEVSLELKPYWSGYIAVDGDSLKINNHRESALLGVDIGTLDIPHLILAEHEDTENWLFFLLVLKYLKYPFKGIVSDGDPAIETAVKLVCPDIPHQFCVKHFQNAIHRYLRYQSNHGRGSWREIQRFEKAVHNCLYANTLEVAEKYLKAIQLDPGFQKVHLEDGIQMLERNFQNLIQHFLHRGLPRTSNVVEGTIRKLDRRLNAMDSFSSHQTAWNILKMLTLYTRFRTLTDCKNSHKHRNGFSPLNLAGINTMSINWIQFGQKQSQIFETQNKLASTKAHAELVRAK